jgi:hypothetical protein
MTTPDLQRPVASPVPARPPAPSATTSWLASVPLVAALCELPWLAQS